MKKIAILQSNYIPWKGYFDLINMVDEFILYDEMQYTKRDWRNRNKIKTAQGVKWLSIPVKVKGKYYQKISETTISDEEWGVKHWNSIRQSYSQSQYFEDYKELFEVLYLNCSEKHLSKINYKFILLINDILGIKTRIRQSSEFDLVAGKTERIIGICKDCNANIYLSGSSAKSYFNEELAKEANVKIEWINYNNYPKYTQLNPPFEHAVSIIDLIFNEGISAIKFMKSFDHI